MKFLRSASTRLCSLVLLGALLAAVRGEAAAVDTTMSTQSRSTQFVVISPLQPYTSRLPRDNPKDNPNLKDVIRVSAAELAISCEQVKFGLLLQLDAGDRWKNRVRLHINPQIPPQAPILINSIQFKNGLQYNWLYELQVPEYVERRKLLRALVQVCLVEIGNRNNRETNTVDVPMWLREGLTEILLNRDGPGIIAEATGIQERGNPQFWILKPGTTTEKVWKDPFSLVRERLKATPPLSFSDLSVPVDDQIASVGLEHFQSCAHLFTSELLTLPDGSGKLRTFVQNLPHFSHPQFAFLHAFREHFSSPLDVEKWWSLAQFNLISREDNARWPEKNALGKLNEILQPQVQIRLGTDSLPVKETYTIKRLITEVDFEQQRPVLQQVVAQLQQLQWNLPPDLLKLVYDYHITLATYLYNREQLSTSGKKSRTVAASTAKPVVREALQQLEFLEILREDFARIGISDIPAEAVTQDRVTEFPKSTP